MYIIYVCMSPFVLLRFWFDGPMTIFSHLIVVTNHCLSLYNILLVFIIYDYHTHYVYMYYCDICIHVHKSYNVVYVYVRFVTLQCTVNRNTCKQDT